MIIIYSILAIMVLSCVIFGVIIWKRINKLHEESRKNHWDIGLKSDGIIHDEDNFADSLLRLCVCGMPPYTFDKASINGKLNILNTEIDNIIKIIGAKRKIQFGRDGLYEKSEGWIESLKNADGKYKEVKTTNKIDDLYNKLEEIQKALTTEV